MDLETKAKLILERWVSSLPARDRKLNSVGANFNDLFEDLANSEIPLEIAHSPAILDKAVAAHMPNDYLVRATYKAAKSAGKVDGTEKEFGESWKNNIKQKAMEAFFEAYDVPVSEKKGASNDAEYRKQRRYANSFPVLDLSGLSWEDSEDET